jgi:hypothetical protein
MCPSSAASRCFCGHGGHRRQVQAKLTNTLTPLLQAFAGALPFRAVLVFAAASTRRQMPCNTRSCIWLHLSQQRCLDLEVCTEVVDARNVLLSSALCRLRAALCPVSHSRRLVRGVSTSCLPWSAPSFSVAMIRRGDAPNTSHHRLQFGRLLRWILSHLCVPGRTRLH